MRGSRAANDVRARQKQRSERRSGGSPGVTLRANDPAARRPARRCGGHRSERGNGACQLRRPTTATVAGSVNPNGTFSPSRRSSRWRFPPSRWSDHCREAACLHATVRRRPAELARQGPHRHRPDERACVLRLRPATGRNCPHVQRTPNARAADVATRTLRRLGAALPRARSGSRTRNRISCLAAAPPRPSLDPILAGTPDLRQWDEQAMRWQPRR